MGCGAQGSKRLEEAEVLTNQLRSTLKKKEVEIERLESQDAASAREVESILKELEDAKRSRIDAEDKVAKVLAEDATLREELERFEANASAEASRSSRLDGHCSVLEVESRTLRDELASSSNVHDDLQQATEQLRRELAAKDQQLAQLQSQLQRLSDESQDFQAQRDYALSELKAANQVAEALKSTSTVLDKRRKPRRSKPNNDVNNEDVQEGPQGVIAAAPELAEKDPRDVFDPANRLAVKALEDHAAVSSATTASPLVLGAAPELPWADTPDVNASKAFGSFPCDAGDAVLYVEESQSPKEQPKELQDISETPKIFSDPSAKVFQFDFSVFDFLKHEALRTPPDSPLEGGAESAAFPFRSDADTGGLRLGAVEAAPLQLPERNGLQAETNNIWSDARWSTRV